VKDGPRVIFMGTPAFAVPSLRALHEGEYPVLCVVTQPDRPKGRRQRRMPPPIKVFAEEKGYPLLQTGSVRTPDVLERIRDLRPDVIAVVAFGALLPRALLEIPPMGAVNIHASLLPKYRGPAPIQWAVINGEEKTGVTAMQMDAGLDTGDILARAETPVLGEDTAETLYDRLSEMGAALLVETLEKKAAGTLTPVPQDHERATYAPMLKKSDGRIDWNAPADAIERRIRGLTPWPGAFTLWRDQPIRIFKARIMPEGEAAIPGTVLESKETLRVATGKGTLCLLELQPASGRRMPVNAFLRGNRIPEGSRLS